ncbi:unnamed protein product [Ectocarpus sp. 4 AP-2014]
MKARTLDTVHTPLDLAVVGGKEAAAKALIMTGANVNTLDSTNDGPLHLAIKGGHVGIAKDLVLGGANPVQAGSNGDFPINLAACHGLDEVVLALGEKGVDLTCLDNKRETPLRLAVIGDHLNKAAAIPALLEAGADIEGRTWMGSTPLQHAAMVGSCALLTLLELGANVNSKDQKGWTPLHYRCKFGNHGTADLLLRWGADETTFNSEGESVVSTVIRRIAQAPEERVSALSVFPSYWHVLRRTEPGVAGASWSFAVPTQTGCGW